MSKSKKGKSEQTVSDATATKDNCSANAATNADYVIDLDQNCNQGHMIAGLKINGCLYSVEQIRQLVSLSPYLMVPLGSFANDPCAGCLSKNGPRDATGHPVVGDSPCQWCPKNPWRFTCKDSSASR